ncbi:MAG: glycerophosphodiester phosphodiesterase [Bacteroidales bacterium]|nr:glycerophosphodiester phosphodiesterase [Bacteroidales bacterium]
MRQVLFAAITAISILSFSCAVQAQVSAGRQRTCRLVAHRGGRFEADENTIPAFKSALEEGITGYELDIHRTADGKYVIMHDFSISRTVNAEGTLELMNYSNIRPLRTKQGNRIPTLDEVLDLFGKYKGLYVEFEMKTSREDLYPEDILAVYAEDVYEAVTKACPEGSTYIFSSFDTRVLKYIKEHHPDAETMLITSLGNTEETRAMAAGVGTNRLACHRARTTLEEMEKAHAEGMLINLWPNADATDVALSYALGADYICTDLPRDICRFIDEGYFLIKK